MRYTHIRIREEADPAGGDGGGEPTGELPALINDDLTFSEGYQARVGEHAEGANFKNLPDVFKSVKEGTRALSIANTEKDKISRELEALKGAQPKTYADDAAFALEVKLPEGLPEGIVVPPEQVAAAAKFAREKGYSPEIVSDFIAFQASTAAAEMQAINNEEFTLAEAAKAEISTQVGPQNYDNTIADAKSVAQTLGLPVDENTLVTNPSFVVTLSKLKSALTEDTLLSAGLTGPGGQTGGAASKLSQADSIVSDKSNPLYEAFWNTADPNHQTAVATHARFITESGAPGQ